MMHPKYDEVVSLLEKGELSQKAIARQLGIGPATVNEIDSQRKLGTPINCEPFICPTCHYRVNQKPCQICAAILHRTQVLGYKA